MNYRMRRCHRAGCLPQAGRDSQFEPRTSLRKAKMSCRRSPIASSAIHEIKLRILVISMQICYNKVSSSVSAMPFLSFQSYHDMPEAELIRRLARLVASAVQRYERAERIRKTLKPAAAVGTDPFTAQLCDSVEQRMLQYLGRVGVASPRDFRRALDISAMTVTRRIARLRHAGLIVGEGATRATVYRLTGDSGRN